MSGWTLGPLLSDAGLLALYQYDAPKHAALLHSVASTSALEEITREKPGAGATRRLQAHRKRALQRTRCQIVSMHRSWDKPKTAGRTASSAVLPVTS